MKIGILTLPFHTNWGGILQAYALMQQLSSLGHEPWLIDQQSYIVPIPLLSLPRELLRRQYYRWIRGERVELWPENKIYSKAARIEAFPRAFVRQYFPQRTRLLENPDRLSEMLEAYAFDALLVGSDQVWRPYFSARLDNYFFGALPENFSGPCIVYAASFGTSDWEFDDALTDRCARALSRSKAISVREDSAVALVKRHFHREAEQVLDPTILYDEQFYAALQEGDVQQQKNQVYAMFLDAHEDTCAAAQSIAAMQSCTVDRLPLHTTDVTLPLYRRRAPSYDRWLGGFQEASYVITDSFHGMLFSIMHRKPFLIYANKQRGMTRFESMLRLLGLEQRIILSAGDLQEDVVRNPIDWTAVETILTRERQRSKEFLIQALS